MYQAKDFYTLAGVKRSTVRHYVEQGLLNPADILENGYAMYTDSQLLDIILLKSERSLDYGIHEITENREISLNQRIENFERRIGEYESEIETYLQKISLLKQYQRILSEMTDTEERIRVDKVGRKTHVCFWINRAMSLYPDYTPQEIEHCIKSFPRVNIILRGRKEDLLNPDVSAVPMQIGYKYEQGVESFTPLYPQLYETLPARPSILLRTTTHSPLQMDKRLLRSIDETMRTNGLYIDGDLYAYIHAVKKTPSGNLYYITARVVVAGRES